jgi:hypothetical protein
VPEAEVVHVGESLGGAIATEPAVRHPCRALILLFPFTSFPAVRAFLDDTRPGAAQPATSLWPSTSTRTSGSPPGFSSK